MTVKVKFLANNFNWSSLASQLKKVRDAYFNASGGKLDFIFDIQQTNFTNIAWYSLPGPVYIHPAWYDQNISSLGAGYHMVVFCLFDQEWLPKDAVGFYTDHDSGPFEIQMKTGPKETSLWGSTGIQWVTKLLIHEIRHALFYMELSASYANKIDPTHIYLGGNDNRLKESLADADYVALELALAGKEKIKIRQIGWNDPEKGLYFPFDTMERRDLLIKKLTELFLDYQLDPNEYNLGQRPWK